MMPKRHRKLWVEDDYVTLAELFIETKSLEEVARKMGRAVNHYTKSHSQKSYTTHWDD